MRSCRAAVRARRSARRHPVKSDLHQQIPSETLGYTIVYRVSGYIRATWGIRGAFFAVKLRLGLQLYDIFTPLGEKYGNCHNRFAGFAAFRMTINCAFCPRHQSVTRDAELNTKEQLLLPETLGILLLTRENSGEQRELFIQGYLLLKKVS